MDELRISFVRQRAENQLTVRSFYGGLIVLVVVVDSRMRQEVALVVLVSEVLRTVHITRLGTQAWIQREKHLLGNVHSIGGGHGIGDFQIVALRLRNLAVSNIVGSDGIKTIKQVNGGVTVRITLTRPDSVVQVL